jgi:CheY-like chemotaxis protein
MVDYEVAIHTTLLLVDDDKQQLELRSLVLKKSGFVVLTAASPIEALAILAQPHGRKVSVAILDYEMPVMNGCVLADYLKARYPDLKIILHSGLLDIPESEMSSVDSFVPKGGGIVRLLGRSRQCATQLEVALLQRGRFAVNERGINCECLQALARSAHVEVDELVDAAIVGFDRRETVTIPSSGCGLVERIRRCTAGHGPEFQPDPCRGPLSQRGVTSDRWWEPTRPHARPCFPTCRAAPLISDGLSSLRLGSISSELRRSGWSPNVED